MIAPQGIALKAFSSFAAFNRIKTVPMRNPKKPMSTLKKITPTTKMAIPAKVRYCSRVKKLLDRTVYTFTIQYKSFYKIKAYF